MVDHVGVDDAVDDELAHVLPLGILQVCEDVCVGLVRQKREEQGDMAVLQHAIVIVHPRELVPGVDQEGVVQACKSALCHSGRHTLCTRLLFLKTSAHVSDEEVFSFPRQAADPVTQKHTWMVHVVTQGRYHERQLFTSRQLCP